MSETTNYKLHLTDDNSERFLDWRERMNGPGESNMIKIDDILGKKADNSVTIEAVLLASAWAGSDVPFLQELAIEGMSATQNGSIALAHSVTAEQREAARMAVLSVVGQEDGKLTIAADKELPAVDIPVYVILLG